MRKTLARIASDHGMVLFAAGSHPLGHEREQHVTAMERYRDLEAKFGLIAARTMVCAMHVHVAVPDPDRRIDLMNRVMPYLPLFYALSTGSPFWEGRNTKLKGYRLAAFSEWPRMGLPELFSGKDEYDRFIARLVGAGVIDNSSFVWWLIRPSNKYPTLEMRICDSCTRLDEAVSIAALYRSLLRAVHRQPELNKGFGPVERGICAENIWQAQHRGLAATFVDPRQDGVLTVPQALEAALDVAAGGAYTPGERAWLERCRDILTRGTSADRQLRWFSESSQEEGDEAALRAVVMQLAEETQAGQQRQ